MPKFVGKRKKAVEEKQSEEEDAASSSDSGPEDVAPPKKNKPSLKPAKKAGGGSGEDVEEASFLLSKNRFVKVRSFRSNVMIDIREYYMGGDGELKPGRKGIALTPVQWEQMKGVTKDVDAAILKLI